MDTNKQNFNIKELSSYYLSSSSKYLIILLCFILLVYFVFGINDIHSLKSFLWSSFFKIKAVALKHLGKEVGSTYFYIFLIGILAFELVIPASEDQKKFSVGFFHDFVWFISIICFVSYFINMYWNFLIKIFYDYLSFLRVDFVSQLPIALQIILVILVGDFLAWGHHYIKHKVPVFWYFHAIHHSQRELNMFTDYRLHFMEFFIENTIRFIPFLSLADSVIMPTSISFILFSRWYTRISHSNLKTNYGFLKYIFVSPQSHRIHHSCEENHFDKNFGVIFSFWDFIFRTQHMNFNEYPNTGIPDKNFPHETELSLKSLILTPVKQTIYPFKMVNQSVKNSFNKIMSRRTQI